MDRKGFGVFTVRESMMREKRYLYREREIGNVYMDEALLQ